MAVRYEVNDGAPHPANAVFKRPAAQPEQYLINSRRGNTPVRLYNGDVKMKVNFDEIVERQGTYSAKWMGAGGGSLDYRNPDVTLPFQVADMDFACPEPIVQAMHRVADHRIFGYSARPEAYTEAFTGWYRRRYGLELKGEWIIPSHGSMSAVNAAVAAFTNVGDGVVICRPVYGHFTGCIERELYRRVANVQLVNRDGYYEMDWDAFEAACARPENRAFILCSPANPVGRVWRREELERMCEITRRNHVLLISDEVHCDLLMAGQRHTPILQATDDWSNLILVTGINKTFNVAGLACANAVIPDDSLRGIFQKEFGHTSLSPFAIAALISAYTACDEWLDQLLTYIEGNIDAAIAFLHEHMPKVKVRKPEGTYILWLDFSAYGLSAEEIHRRIYEEARVLLQDGTVHDPELGGQFQRICVPCAREVLLEGLRRMAKAFPER